MSTLTSPFRLSLVAGWTKEIGPFTLKNKSGPFRLDGYTVVAVVKSASGVAIPMTLRKDSDQATNPGNVFLTPDHALDDADSPASLHFEVTDGFSKVELWPSGPGDSLIIHKK